MKKLLALLLALVMVFALAACGEEPAPTTSTEPGTAESTAPEDGDSLGYVGISMPTQSLERWNRDGAFLRDQFEASGYQAELLYANNEVDQQVSDIQNLIADGVDLLVISAIDGESLNTVVDEAAENGIPVIAYDRLIMNDNVDYYVSFDNYSVGVLQGQFLEENLGLADRTADDPAYIEFTAGDPADNNAPFFYNGAMSVLQPYLDSSVLVCRSGQTDFDAVATEQWNTDTALDRAQTILASYYSGGERLDAWLCSNDSTALGVTQAVTSDYTGDNTVTITGQDGDVANLRNVLDGTQAMTVYKAVANEAVATLDIASAILAGDPVDQALIDAAGWDFEASLDTETYTTSDSGHAATSVLLVPETVTKDNYEEVLVTPGYYEVGEDGYLVAVE
ncbi:MAG TPA: sugar-binding protein [Candidatus Scatomorpha merdigallinarum]|nr:sugar-binding protein [Candidatus Scatomorpha merdigallinarum]